MLLSGITSESFYQSPVRETPGSHEMNRDLAELRRKLFSGELSGSDKAAVQTQILQAERALKSGKEAVARQFVEQASDTIKDKPGQDVAPGSPAPVAPESVNKQDADKRIYQDISNDPSVSFQYPTSLNKYQAPVAVRAHENEHVQEAVFTAQNEGVLARVQVRYQFGVDANGKRYLKGGQTSAAIPSKKESPAPSHLTKPRIDFRI